MKRIDLEFSIKRVTVKDVQAYSGLIQNVTKTLDKGSVFNVKENTTFSMLFNLEEKVDTIVTVPFSCFTNAVDKVPLNLEFKIKLQSENGELLPLEVYTDNPDLKIDLEVSKKIYSNEVFKVNQ